MMKNNVHWVPLYLNPAQTTNAIREMSVSFKRMVEEQK